MITDMLGTPSGDTIAGVRNDKALKYLMDMRKKNPIPFSQKFSNADPLALPLLERMLAFDPKERPTAEKALADPYFKGLSNVDREPACQPISKLEFEFDRRRVTKEDVREMIYREILEYHPQLLKDYINGSEGANFIYLSAIGQFKKQFAHLEEESCGRSGPVIPLARKHISLPRSTVYSSTIPPKPQPTSLVRVLRDQRSKDESKSADVDSGICFASSKQPLKIPSAKPGEVGLVPNKAGRSMKESYDPSIMTRKTVISQQSASPHYLFRAATTLNLVKPTVLQETNHGVMTKQVPMNLCGQSGHKIAIGINTNSRLYTHHQQSQPKVDPFNSRVALDAKIIQEQSQVRAEEGASHLAVLALSTLDRLVF